MCIIIPDEGRLHLETLELEYSRIAVSLISTYSSEQTSIFKAQSFPLLHNKDIRIVARVATNMKRDFS